MRASHRRSGFTLIELLVVTGLILVLATLTVAVISKVRDDDAAREGADKMQGWLLMAKQWALRDQTARGVRLVADSSGNVTQALFIEEPDPFVGPAGSGVLVRNVTDIKPILPDGFLPSLFSTFGSQLVWRPELQGGVVVTAYQGTIDFSGGWWKLGDPWPPTDPTNLPKWPVQVGDLIEFGSGINATVFRILDIQQTVTNSANPNPAIALITGPPSNVAGTNAGINQYVAGADFRIVRQVRPKAGEMALQLPNRCAMSATAVAAYGGYLPAGPAAGVYDIIFEPTGVVRGATRPIQLWFVDTSKDKPSAGTFGGPQFIVSVNVRTGLVATSLVDVTPKPGDPTKYADPFSFTRDGKASGL